MHLLLGKDVCYGNDPWRMTYSNIYGKHSVWNKDLKVGGHRATGFLKAGGQTENPVARTVFHEW